MTSGIDEIKKGKEERRIKQNVLLIIMSLLSILFMTFHLTEDIIYGMAKGASTTFIAVPVLVVWLYGTLVLNDRKSGYIIILIGSLIGLLVPILHMTGTRVDGDIAKSSGGFFFIWTLIALGMTSLFSIILSVRALSLR